MKGVTPVIMDVREVTEGWPDGPGRIGLAVIALRQCGMSREEIQDALDVGNDEIVRRIWTCVGSMGALSGRS
jgi:hypothetical protein